MRTLLFELDTFSQDLSKLLSLLCVRSGFRRAQPPNWLLFGDLVAFEDLPDLWSGDRLRVDWLDTFMLQCYSLFFDVEPRMPFHRLRMDQVRLVGNAELWTHRFSSFFDCQACTHVEYAFCGSCTFVSHPHYAWADPKPLSNCTNRVGASDVLTFILLLLNVV